MKRSVDEHRLAEQIVSVLPEGVVRACSADRSVIRYSVSAPGLKLRSVVLNRMSLRKLADDPVRDVKIEYLQRELRECAAVRSEFRYPHLHLRPSGAPKRFHFGLPVASMF